MVGTPSRVLVHLKAGHIDVSESLETLVIDEADLIFSFNKLMMDDSLDRYCTYYKR